MIYDDYSDKTEQGKPKRKRASLDHLLMAAEKELNIAAVRIENKHPAPSELLPKVVAQLRPLAELTPSMADVVQAAQVSRRTVYMYFPTLEQLLLDATLGALGQETIQPVVAEPDGDPVMRVEKLSRAVNSLSGRTMHLGRALIRLTVEADEPPRGTPRRGYRRI